MTLPEKHFLPFAGLAGSLLATVVWSILVLGSLFAQREQLNRTAAELARIDAVANLKKDMAIRKWASTVEGVFVREKHLPPINSLEQEERYMALRSTGERFPIVSVTPMHLLLAIQGMTNQEFGSRERLTSNQLRNIDNAPDEWEKQALAALNKGASIVAENLPKKGSHGLMRAMIPMKMEEECLECHRDTLVPVGGLRGGATVAIDLNTYRSAQEPTWQAIRFWHGGIWLLGVATILLLHHVSHRRAAELQRQDQLRRENEMAFGAMAEGAVITDASGTILWVNDAFCRISGYLRDEVIGANPRLLKSGVHDTAFYAAMWRQLINDGHWRGEIWNRRKNGEVFPEEISMQALRGPNGRIRRYISIFSDITERKRNERELAAYREHLEELVRQRTEELTVARDQAEAANLSKSVFLANMSHELRTPLNAVIGFSKLMEDDPALPPDRQRNLKIINHSGRHLLTLINDVLELSKIESGKMEMRPEEVRLAELLEQVVEMVRLRAEEKGLALRLVADALPPAVELDPGMLRQVLLNLLSNAVKFTEHGEIVVRVVARSTAPERAKLDFSVRDTGIGIAPADHERIFGSFEQVGPAHQGGTGLGLTISRSYVRMMGGELALDSQPGAGADFRFTIDVPVVAATRPVADGAARLRLERPLTLLVVDDSPEGRLLLRSLLEPLGFAIAEAANLAETRDRLAAGTIDLVLLDWFLPDGEGIDLVRQLRARPGSPALVMLTANALAESRDEALAAGVDAFLSKPFAPAELLRTLADVLGLALTPAETPPADGDAVADWLADLAPEARERLVRAAISLNPQEIEAAIAGIAAASPALGERLRALARQRRYQALWAMLDIEGSET
ncbi:ATP-binding protein [Azonexus sp.]|uniref:ATP-binding protein n=1 Tax=Azonexus sp. TaxID=1872668 RepID=UPI0035B47223